MIQHGLINQIQQIKRLGLRTCLLSVSYKSLSQDWGHIALNRNALVIFKLRNFAILREDSASMPSLDMPSCVIQYENS